MARDLSVHIAQIALKSDDLSGDCSIALSGQYLPDRSLASVVRWANELLFRRRNAFQNDDLRINELDAADEIGSRLEACSDAITKPAGDQFSEEAGCLRKRIGFGKISPNIKRADDNALGGARCEDCAIEFIVIDIGSLVRGRGGCTSEDTAIKRLKTIIEWGFVAAGSG